MMHPSGKYYDSAAASYDRDYSSPYWQLYFDITWQNMSRYLPNPGSAILDAGGGTGIFAIKLAEMGYKVTLVDISGSMLSQARLKAKSKGIKEIKFVRGDIRKMDFLQPESFDFVLCQGDVLSYCEDHMKAISELARVCKIGCCIVASVGNVYPSIKHAIETSIESPNGSGIEDIKKMLESGQTSYFGRFPVKAFVADELKSDFAKCGLTVADTIGKPVLMSFLKREEADNLLLDKKFYDAILKLELEYCNKQPFMLFGSHLEIVAKKEKNLKSFFI